VLELLLGFVAAPAIEIQDEEFSLADVAHGRVSEAREGVLNRLPLGIEYGAFRHYPDVCFHAASIALPLTASCSEPLPGGEKGVLETHLDDAGQFVFLKAHARGVGIFLLQCSVKHGGIIGGEHNGNAVAKEFG